MNFDIDTDAELAADIDLLINSSQSRADVIASLQKARVGFTVQVGHPVPVQVILDRFALIENTTADRYVNEIRVVMRTTYTPDQIRRHARWYRENPDIHAARGQFTAATQNVDVRVLLQQVAADLEASS